MMRVRCPQTCSVLLLLFTASGILSANIIRVPADQATIQAAISASVNGDTVLVAPGTYHENINFLGKAITLASEQGPAATVIDGSGVDSVVKFGSGEGRNSVLDGFTLQNGLSTFNTPGFGNGGGIWVNITSPTIRNNAITNNRACAGSGIFVNFGSPLIQGNTVSHNTQYGCSGGTGGGGIMLAGAAAAEILNNIVESNTLTSANGAGISLFAAGNPTIIGNTIRNNTASGLSPCAEGGGIAMVNQSDALIVNNLVSGNSAGCGGGIYWGVPSGTRGPYLVNNTIVGNAANQGSAIYAGGFQSQTQLINNILVSSAATAALYCDGTYGNVAPAMGSNDVYAPAGVAYGGLCSGLAGSNGNISADPMFVNPVRDFHVLPGSPAIDSGTSNQAPLTDIEGMPRPLDGNGDGNAAFDMGAYEAKTLDRNPPITTATFSPLPGAAGWNTTAIIVTLAATDAGSGTRQIQYSLSGAQAGGPFVVPGSAAAFTLTAEGATTVSYFATDVAGNVEGTQTLSTRIDKTAPLISGMPAPGCTLSPAKHQMVQVAAVTAVDALSGVSSLKVSATSNQPDSGTGGGDLPGDIVINGGIVQLRAEHSPASNSRIYTITAVANDVAGNSRTATAVCTVSK